MTWVSASVAAVVAARWATATWTVRATMVRVSSSRRVRVNMTPAYIDDKDGRICVLWQRLGQRAGAKRGREVGRPWR